MCTFLLRSSSEEELILPQRKSGRMRDVSAARKKGTGIPGRPPRLSRGLRGERVWTPRNWETGAPWDWTRWAGSFHYSPTGMVKGLEDFSCFLFLCILSPLFILDIWWKLNEKILDVSWWYWTLTLFYRREAKSHRFRSDCQALSYSLSQSLDAPCIS